MTIKIFFFKITKDLLISFIITYFLLLVPELVLPGIISSHFSPKYILVFILMLGWLFAWQGKNFSGEESVKFKSVSKNILNVILFVITVMLVLSLYKMGLWQILVVTSLSILLLVATEHILAAKETEKK